MKLFNWCVSSDLQHHVDLSWVDRCRRQEAPEETAASTGLWWYDRCIQKHSYVNKYISAVLLCHIQIASGFERPFQWSILSLVARCSKPFSSKFRVCFSFQVLWAKSPVDAARSEAQFLQDLEAAKSQSSTQIFPISNANLLHEWVWSPGKFATLMKDVRQIQLVCSEVSKAGPVSPYPWQAQRVQTLSIDGWRSADPGCAPLLHSRQGKTIRDKARYYCYSSIC